MSAMGQFGPQDAAAKYNQTASNAPDRLYAAQSMTQPGQVPQMDLSGMLGDTGQSQLQQGQTGLMGAQSGLFGSSSSFGGGKGGSPGIDASPIQGGGGSGAPGLSHIKDYGPQVDQLQQYVQNMQQLIQQMNSKF